MKRAVRADRERGGQRGEHPHRGRERHRQGADRQRHPPPLRARPRPVHQDQLRRHPARPDRERAVRLPQGRLHRARPTDKVGLFEMAEGGSLLLDEIGEMPSALQTKLLRVLQQREYRPIGSDRTVRVDFRLICSTNVDLEQALRDGRVREDLYFRINTITLRVPPLRERTEDIPLHLQPLPGEVQPALRAVRARHLAGGLPPAHPQPVVGQRPRAGERHGAGRAGVQDGGDHARRSAGDAARRRRRRRDEFTLPPGPHAGGDRTDGHRADAGADQLEQAGGRAAAGALPADALQQDAQAQDRGRTRPVPARQPAPCAPHAPASTGRPAGSASPSPVPNRLASEHSPYLLQHQHNPVDWYPWGRRGVREGARRRTSRSSCRSATPPATGAT